MAIDPPHKHDDFSPPEFGGDAAEQGRWTSGAAFLLDIGGAFSAGASTDQVINSVGDKIYRYLGVSKLLLSTVDDAAGTNAICYERDRTGLMPIPQPVRQLSTVVNEAYWPGLKAGQMTIIEATGRLLIPVSQTGKWVFLMLLETVSARHWPPEEQVMLQAIAVRLFQHLHRTPAERFRQHSEERQRLILESAKDYAIFTTDLHRRVTSWNAGAVALLGYPEADIIGQLADGLFTPEDQERQVPAQELKTAIREGKAENERWHVRQDGSRFYGSGIVTPLRDETGTNIGVVKVMRDLTRQKMAEDALFKSEQQLRAFIMASSDTLYKMNADWTAICNLQGVPFFLQVPDAGPQWPELYIPEADRPRVLAAIDEAIRTRSIFELEHQVNLADGSVGWTISKAIPLFDERGEIREWFGTASNITDRKRAEEALIQADRRKDEFLAMLAHELRNPLAPISNILQILQLTAELDQTLRPMLDIMSRQVTHLIRLVDDLLDVSRISRGQIELRRERLDLVALLVEAVATIRPLYDEQRRQLHLSLPQQPVYLNADATRLTQVISNLLTNGLRYTAENGQVWVNLELYDKNAVLRVQDNGIGLTPDQMDAIFELFVQVDNSPARTQGGLGIGLTLVQRLVEQHGGWVKVRSEGPGRGSEFIVTFPLWKENRKVINEDKEGVSSSKVEGYRILVVDDNADAAMTLSMLLKLKGHDVHTCHSGQEGITRCELLQPDVVLLDIGMPELDGYETCQQLRRGAWGQHVIVIALTGYGQDEDRQRSMEAGFNGHLVKPIDLFELNQLFIDMLPPVGERRR